MKKQILLSISILIVVSLGAFSFVLVQAQFTTAQVSWNIQRVDAPKMFSDMGPRSLALDSQGHPHIAYGGDFLYYAYYDGSVWQYEIVDDTDRVGKYASLALDASGAAHIAYFDERNGDLKYARRTDNGWQVQTVQSDGIVGEYASVAVDANGNPYIVYHYRSSHGSSSAVRYARWTMGWSIQTIESGVPGGTSIVVDQSGNAHIAYMIYDASSQKLLRYAHWTGSNWQIQTVDSGGGAWPSLALDGNGNAHIAYFKDDTLKYAHSTGSEWQTEQVTVVGGRYNSLALDSNGNPHISTFYGTLSGLTYAYRTSTGWQIEQVEWAGDTGYYTSLALDSDDVPLITYFERVGGSGLDGRLKLARRTGSSSWNVQVVVNTGAVSSSNRSLALDGLSRPHIAYYAKVVTDGDLKYARWTESGWQFQTVDAQGNVGMYASLALDSNGNANISYLDATNKDLKYARWTGSNWIIVTVDSNGDVGVSTSIALDSAGNPHIAYYYNDGFRFH